MRSSHAVTALARLAVITPALVVAGCGAGRPSVTPAPPTPIYTKEEASACISADLVVLDDWDSGTFGRTAEQLLNADLGDLTVARQQAEAAASRYAALVARFTGTGADAEGAALVAALQAGEAAFARPLTREAFDVAYAAIEDARKAFSDRCNEIELWVRRNLPQ